MAVDQETRAFLEQARRDATKPRHEQTVAEARAGLAGLGALFAHGPAMAQEKELSVPVAGAELPVRLLVPNGVPSGLIVYFHGGGWVIGSVAEFTPLGRVLADATGCAVALVGYRKAPENPYPGPVDDAWAGLLWCAEHVSVLAGRDVPLLVAGDSAGASLAAATTLRARAAGPRLAGQILAYPVTDHDLDRPSYVDPGNQLMLTRDTMIWYWDHYLPDLERRSEAEASPLRAADHRALPPAVIVTAEHDVLRDEGEAYAQALLDVGVAVTLRRFPGQMHAFLMMVGLLPGSEAGARFIGAEVHRMLHGPATVVQEGKRS
jgi:acetyl esterase